MDGEAIIAKLKSLQPLSADEMHILKIYNSKYAKKAGNAGKRVSSGKQVAVSNLFITQPNIFT